MKTLITFILLSYVLPAGSVAASTVCIAEESTIPYGIQDTKNDTTTNGLSLKPFYLDLVPPSSGIQFYRNGIIFLGHSKDDLKVPEKHLSFGTLKTFMTTIQDTVPGIYMPFLLSSEVIFPCEATTFTNDFNTMYVSLIPPKGNKEKIFKAVYGSSGWNIEKNPLSFCEDNFIFTHPSISSEGTFMVFSSDMSGSAGGLDLYISRNKDGNWSKPENLGRNINSTGNELFASLDASNNLYFSSDGIPGKGGYDIFVSKYNGSGWDEPHNLSETINTVNDEVAFTIDRSDNISAFYTVRARTEKINTQLKSITLNPGPGKTADNLSQRLLAGAGIKYFVVLAKSETPVATASTTPEKSVVKELPVEQKATPEKAKQEITVVEKKEVATPQNKPETVPGPDVKKDVVIYRVQILANTRPVGSYNITVEGKTYKSFEYLYKGGYRTTIGEFSTLAEAAKLQTTCRKSGYDQAFVVAFKNNIRTTDPQLFK